MKNENEQKIWTNIRKGVFQLSKQLSKGRNYHENQICTDDFATIVKVLKSFQPPKRTRR